MLDKGTLDDIFQRIVEVARPERIILFGSAAHDDMGPHSDVDLLIIKQGVDLRRLTAKLYRRLHGVGAAVDAIMVTPEDVERYKDSHALIIKPALREGRVVYESA
ncbi:MAG: nucleotidyltransferase domain-containing protein [Nitrospira sp. SB0677_bin_15]|nr:nucleotidyltransferase domain-containing protein [Nitrospira sp. SB0667_bin_9]MYD31537.1 nucleotidyltransferase domain-containing protein [Nitrospira sp. SB0661_bin_20]MYG40191.1 nucleotidyltransferase domain-containing protein [Nitrospira sp. SB0677_bin_15]MYH01524.1 nucleotidyltransferase domain-containing protein [Nitrospira sp. SB0675_bin_23]MYJ23167.1 nucleotidyltransferase domain-containing protein [Nitrospira sp. SB0673_bin_12]